LMPRRGRGKPDGDSPSSTPGKDYSRPVKSDGMPDARGDGGSRARPKPSKSAPLGGGFNWYVTLADGSVVAVKEERRVAGRRRLVGADGVTLYEVETSGAMRVVPWVE
jgi:hypothetical protein